MPSRTISNRFYYVYVLQSERDPQQYIGFTADLKKRLQQHQRGESFATAPRRPFTLAYYEACRSKEDALRREEYLKHSEGRRFLAKRLKVYYRRDNSKLY